MKLKVVHVIAIFLISVTVAPKSGHAQNVSRSLEKITGDVYLFQNEIYNSMVTVTEEGVVVADPINSYAVGWLKKNLSSITDRPVTHLIYSHSHSDHASGGIYLRAKTVIAQQLAPKSIDGVKPTVRFGDEMTIRGGRKSFELTWLGEGHGIDTIAIVVRPENVAFIVDVASPKTLPFRDMPNSDIDGWINQLKKLQTLDFDIFALGHGALGVKEDVDHVLVYMEKLRARVLAGLEDGKSVPELKKSITMSEYESWSDYQSVELNVAGMARYLLKTGKVNR